MSQEIKNHINLASFNNEKHKNNQIYPFNNLIFQPYQISYNRLFSLNESSNDYLSKSNEKLDSVEKKYSNAFKRKSIYTEDSEGEDVELRLINSFNRSKNINEAFSILNIMWRNLKFCDLIIVCNEHDHLAHKAVLSFFSYKYR